MGRSLTKSHSNCNGGRYSLERELLESFQNIFQILKEKEKISKQWSHYTALRYGQCRHGWAQSYHVGSGSHAQLFRLMRPFKKAKRAVHGCHFPGDMAVRMCEVDGKGRHRFLGRMRGEGEGSTSL